MHEFRRTTTCSDQWSISVSGNWRITFEIEDDEIKHLDLEDSCPRNYSHSGCDTRYLPFHQPQESLVAGPRNHFRYNSLEIPI